MREPGGGPGVRVRPETVARRRGGLAIAAALLVAATPPLAAHHLNLQLYSRVEGLPQHQVMALLQDRSGYLWFGTYGGLARYDGSEVETYHAADGLASNVIVDLVEDRSGRLWAATEGGGLCALGEGRFRCSPVAGPRPGAAITDLHPERRGGLWVATAEGLTLLSAGGATHYAAADGLPSDSCLEVSEDAVGQVWVGTGAGLALKAGERFVPMWPERLGGGAVQLVTQTPGGLLVGAGAALYVVRLDRDGPILEPVPLGASLASDLTDAVEGPHGVLWVTSRSGVFRVDGEAVRRLTRESGLPTDGVYRVLVDREENLWFGTDLGAAKLAPSPFETFSEQHGLPNPFVRALAEDGEGRVWVGTRQGVAVWERGVLRPLVTSHPLLAGRVYALAAVPGGGGMLIGADAGLVLWDGGVRRVWREADGLPGSGVRSLQPAPGGAVWIGTTGGLALLERGRLRTFPGEALLDGPTMAALALDGRGDLWIGLRDGGLLRFDGERAARYGAAEGLSDQAVWDLDLDREGRLWVGTNGDGLFRLDPGSGDRPGVTRFTAAEGLIDDFVWQVLAGPDATWIYTGHGLDRFDGSSFRHYGRGDGLIDLEGSAGAALETAAGERWFGTASGLIRHLPGAAEVNRVPPPAVVEEVTTAGAGPLAPGGSFLFDTGPVTFRFAALSFRHEAAVRHRYRLRGLSDVWSEPTGERRISFARLSPGRYVFEVEGANDDGLWSEEPAAFPFSVRPALWQTWWFRLLVAAAVVSGLGLAVRLRLTGLEADRRRLESLVAERTAELERAAARLADLATTDELTGVHNRRHFLQLLDSEIKRLDRAPAGTALSLLLLDVDHFKSVNDRYGHQAGDRALRTLAERLLDAVRTTDVVARYGGEEFAILLPATDLAGAALAARKVQAMISRAPFDLGPHALPMSVSVGAAEARWEGVSRQEAAADLVERADAALYTAKWRGRDRVVVEEAGRFEDFPGPARTAGRRRRPAQAWPSPALEPKAAAAQR